MPRQPRSKMLQQQNPQESNAQRRREPIDLTTNNEKNINNASPEPPDAVVSTSENEENVHSDSERVLNDENDNDRDPFDVYKDDINDKEELHWLSSTDFMNVNRYPVRISFENGKRKINYDVRHNFHVFYVSCILKPHIVPNSGTNISE